MQWLGVPSARIKSAELTIPWFQAEFPSFPFDLATARLRRADIQEFFERPTKTEAFQAFGMSFAAWRKAPRCQALLFKSPGFTLLSLYTSPVMGLETGTALRFRVQEREFYLSTLKEFCDVYRERSGPLGT